MNCAKEQLISFRQLQWESRYLHCKHFYLVKTNPSLYHDTNTTEITENLMSENAGSDC